MNGCNGEGLRINSFALVSYIPGPLAGFLDRLRKEIVAGCQAKAHVTILPPRPLVSPPEEAWNEVQQRLQDFQPFRVDLGDIEVFPVTDVIYVAVKAGGTELQKLHSALNRGEVEFEEPFEYHPHITLAQDLAPGSFATAHKIAVDGWREFSGARSFVADELVFVQNTMNGRWLDLERWWLSSSVASR